MCIRDSSSSPRMIDDYPSFGDSSLLGANVYYRGTVALGRTGLIPAAHVYILQPGERGTHGEETERPAGLLGRRGPARGRVRTPGQLGHLKAPPLSRKTRAGPGDSLAR